MKRGREAHRVTRDPASAERVGTTGDFVSADITVRHGEFIPDGPARSDADAARARNELQLADDMARELNEQIERLVATQLDRVI